MNLQIQECNGSRGVVLPSCHGFTSENTGHTPLAFVITSDDPKWCRINLRSSPDTIVVGNKNRPEADLALLASCNHTIFDYGTYGLTAAMFNFEGRTVVFDTGSAENSVTDQLALKFISWIKLGNSPLSIPEN